MGSTEEKTSFSSQSSSSQSSQSSAHVIYNTIQPPQAQVVIFPEIIMCDEPDEFEYHPIDASALLMTKKIDRNRKRRLIKERA
ncbi:2273_t:CDS:2, partial [Paraglomus occultum]